jgi:hypothetical protein
MWFCFIDGGKGGPCEGFGMHNEAQEIDWLSKLKCISITKC